MSRRSEQRRDAAFLLYEAEIAGQPVSDVLDRGASELTRSLVHAADDLRDQLDEIIGRYAIDWRIERIAMLERCIMRIALVEMLYPDAVPAETPIPPEGAIDQAVEVAKEYCGAQSPGFVNGILNAAIAEIGETAASDD
ncbi:unannotated protein [freshwater metagenome]|uniref:Unannotated protein n=1 Tax=freshwater metagenome TaxID=449393 RepID=A0A6J6A1T3_9ZZZZ|nr:antitermination protein NusB [Actinomycetota bacterium]MSX12438.1 antitermination protein NusB [Actinomycetota bacterium]